MKVIDPKSFRVKSIVLRHQQRWDMGTTYGFRPWEPCPSIIRRLALLAGLCHLILSSLQTIPRCSTDRLIRAVLSTMSLSNWHKTSSQLPHPFRVKDQGLGRYQQF